MKLPGNKVKVEGRTMIDYDSNLLEYLSISIHKGQEQISTIRYRMFSYSNNLYQYIISNGLYYISNQPGDQVISAINMLFPPQDINPSENLIS